MANLQKEGLLYGYNGTGIDFIRNAFLKIKESEDYFIVLTLKGAIPYSKKDLVNNNIDIGTLVKKLKDISLWAQKQMLYKKG